MKSWIFAILAAAATVASAADWPGYLGPNRNGITTGSVSTGTPRTVWKANVGKGCSAFAVAKGKAITLGNDGKHNLWCRRPACLVQPRRPHHKL